MSNVKERSKKFDKSNWWDKVLTELAPRTLLIKGSMSALWQRQHKSLLVGREALIAFILRFGGIVVEAKKLKVERNRWEVTDGDPVLRGQHEPNF